MAQQQGTTAEDYARRYYAHYSDTDEPYSWDSPGWRAFFTLVAQRLVAINGPTGSVLDVGCAKGLLVQALAEQGVDAHGVDISDTSIGDAHPDVRDRLAVVSAAEPFEGRFDFVTCIEVLEHMSPRDAERAIDNMCAVTDRVVLSSTPGDFDEVTHINVHPVADWVAAFATRGFYRRTDVDLGFLSPWAVFFERAELTQRDLVHRYETMCFPMRSELLAKREELLKAHRELERLDTGEQLEQLQHELLRARDAAQGSEATAGQARHERDVALLRVDEAEQALAGARDAANQGRLLVARFEAELAQARVELAEMREAALVAQHELAQIRASERWRIGGAIVAPIAAIQRRRGR